MTYTLAELALHVNGEVMGDPNQEITHLSPIEKGGEGALSVLSNPLYQKYLQNTKSSVILMDPKFKYDCPVSAILHKNPYHAFASITHLFEDKKEREYMLQNHSQSSSSTQIAKEAIVHPSAIVGPNAVIMPHAHIHENAIIGAGSIVGYASSVGPNTELKPNVSVLSKVKIGAYCVIQPGVVIGSDGFGYAENEGQWQRVIQLGGVTIGDNVEIGANTTIDRGAMEDTIIEDGVILDNQIQIAHNVNIGKHTAIAGCVGIAGSTKIGAYCRIGGGAGIAGHLQIHDHTYISAWTMVIKSITKSGIYSSGMPAKENKLWRKNISRFHRLDRWVDKIENELEDIKQKLTEQ